MLRFHPDSSFARLGMENSRKIGRIGSFPRSSAIIAAGISMPRLFGIITLVVYVSFLSRDEYADLALLEMALALEGVAWGSAFTTMLILVSPSYFSQVYLPVPFDWIRISGVGAAVLLAVLAFALLPTYFLRKAAVALV